MRSSLSASIVYLNDAEYECRYTVFIDAIVQSMGHAFVGTDKSTMSLLGQLALGDELEKRCAGRTKKSKPGVL